jgi:excinuclease UvrABC ATPase subunit
MQPTGVKEVSARRELAHGSVSERDGVVSVDQDAIRGSRRSNPAT